MSTATPKRLALSKVPVGEPVRFSAFDKGTIWIRGAYIRERKQYELHKADDANHFAYRRGTFTVFAGFDY